MGAVVETRKIEHLFVARSDVVERFGSKEEGPLWSTAPRELEMLVQQRMAFTGRESQILGSSFQRLGRRRRRLPREGSTCHFRSHQR